MWLTRPDDPAESKFETSEEAYELLWKFRGWEPCDPPPLEYDDDPEAVLDGDPADDVDDPQPDPAEAAPRGDTKE